MHDTVKTELIQVKCLIIEQGIRKDFVLKKNIEKQLKCNYETIRKKFRNTFGMTIRDYHNFVLLNRAILLLKENNKIYVIAILLGFCDDSHFILWFKKQTGMTPDIYKTRVSFNFVN